MLSRALVRLVSYCLLVFGLHAAHLVYRKNIGANLVATDSAGNVYATDGVSLTKLDPSGNVVYATQLSLNGSTVGMTMDAAGSVILVGNTGSDSLPTTQGVFQPKRSPGVCYSGDKYYQPYPCPDAFVAKYDASGKLAWASYLGGLSTEYAYSVATDSHGNIYVAGLTQSSDFPRVKPFQADFGGYADAFLTKISADGRTILYSSTIGGSGYDIGYAVVVDSSGDAYLGGVLASSMPGLPAGGFGTACSANGLNGFVVKVNPAGDAVEFGGCLKGGYSTVTALAFDPQGYLYAGGVAGKDFPATRGTFFSAPNIGYTGFLQKFTPDGSAMLYSAVFPGASFGVTSIATAPDGSTYLTGPLNSNQFPIAGPAMQPCSASSILLHDYLLHLSADGATPLYSSFEQSTHLALASDGALYLGGNSLRKLTAIDLPGDPFLSSYCVLNGASKVSHLDYGQTGISPGEIVILQGTGLGPTTAADGVAVNGTLTTSLARTQVLFDGIPAPLMSVQDAQITVLAPYALAGRTTTSIQVQYQGQSTDPVQLPVSPVSPALFRNPDGTPQVLNSDCSVNSKSNPAARGAIVILYMTGAGQTDPPSADGQIWQTIGGLQQPVSAELKNYGTAGTVDASTPVIYAGPVPSLVSGEQQLNILLPADLGDWFVTREFSAGSLISVQIGPLLLSASVYVR